MTLWRMRIACWIPKAIDTHSEYVILIDFPLQQWIRERASLFTFIITFPGLLCIVQITFIPRSVKQGKCFKASISPQDGQNKQRKGAQRQTAARIFQLQRTDAGSSDAFFVLPPNQPPPQVCSLSKSLVTQLKGLHGSKLLERWASPWLRKAGTVTSPRWPGLNSSQVRVRFVVDKMTLEEVSLLILRCSPVTSIPPVFQTPTFIDYILITNLMHRLLLIYKLLFLYVFRAINAHLQEDAVVHMQHMVLSLSMRVRGGLSVHSLSEN